MPPPISGRAVSMARAAALRPALSPSKHRIGSAAMPQSRAHWSVRQRRAKRGDGLGKAGRRHGDDIDIALDRDDPAPVVGGLAGAVVVVEAAALVEERRLRAVEIFGGRGWIERAPAEGDDAARAVADREHDAVAEPVVRHFDVLAVDQAGRPRSSCRGGSPCRRDGRATRSARAARGRSRNSAARPRPCRVRRDRRERFRRRSPAARRLRLEEAARPPPSPR